MTETERRYELNSLLKDILGSDNVYYQPPENLKLKFPCIIYELSGYDVIHADNSKYNRKRKYTVMLVDKDPDSIFGEKLLDLDFCKFDRKYANDGVYHEVYNIYY